jgi:hypothetical protein
LIDFGRTTELERLFRVTHTRRPPGT